MELVRFELQTGGAVTVEVEEAYGLYTAAPWGMAPKFGRFLSSIGYLNDVHQQLTL